MKQLLCVVLMIPAVYTLPWVEMSQAHEIMTDIYQGVHTKEVFQTFKQDFGKTYESEHEEAVRMKIFEMNVQRIKEHNQLFERGEKSYYLGVNQFTDLTHKEFLHLYTGLDVKGWQTRKNATAYIAPANLKCEDSFDWRKQGAVTGVKNQGYCGSCWSFSTTGALEGQRFRKDKVLVSLSEQQLVDCAGSYGLHGCNGGWMNKAFNYIEEVGGINSEADYPYLAKQQDGCYYNESRKVAEVTGYVNVKSGSESELKEAVCSEGPMAVAINAGLSSFASYAGGVYDEPSCNSGGVNHAVLVVGYGTEPANFWLVKNSWGKSWGMDGYIKMARDKENQCKIASYASYPLV